MTPTCRHRLALAEVRWDAVLLRCVTCGFETVAARCIGILRDSSRCPAPVSDPEFSTCERHVDQEPPKWGPA